MKTVTLAVAALAAAGMLSACNQQDEGASVSSAAHPSTASSHGSTTTSSAATSGASSSGSTTGAGADGASRAGTLTTSGGWYADGSTITFVYNDGIRYSIDTGSPISNVRETTSTSSKGTLRLTPTMATWVSTTGTPSTVDLKGAGVIADPSGVIGVLPDGSVTCANKQGLQFVGSDGTKGAASKSGLFYIDKSGKKTVVGQPPTGGKLAGRYLVCNVGNTSTVELNADVLFAYGSAALTPAGKQVVDQTAASIKSHISGKTVAVVGNTDSKGTAAFNLKLGMQRAEAVAAELRKDLPGIKLKVSSNGASKPIASNTLPDGADNPAGRAKNRRVTISWANS
ncbi:OmpA family protein [Flexivirga caeni]|uniref:OmpA family protein n=2 Tax=Flexivirga caeni TaxID=2294115 RepID=A0A3M9M4J7_9MICO|nr:OmpA family protein [Flexivirga caeni]